MSESTAQPERGGEGRGLWSYNLRILLGNSYWLIVAPVAAAQLVLFWNMATATLFSPVRAAQTIELLAPILGAYLCAHALAPEQAGVRELVFARPVSLEKVLLVRLSVMFAFVLAVLAPAMVVYHFGIKAFPLGLTVLAGLPSLLFLSVLAMSVATAAQAPLLGLAAAAAYWALDLGVGSYFNPLFTLHGFADYLAERPMSDQWVAGKLLLLGLAGLCYLWNRSLLTRPAGPRRWRTAVRVGAVVLVILFAYVSGGAGYKILYGLRHERELGNQTYLWYKRQFRAYGPLPVARLFGPAFALYVKPPGQGVSSFSWVGSAMATPEELAGMARLVQRYPHSIWADNAAYELARSVSREPASKVWAITTYWTGDQQAAARLIEDNLAGAAQALQDFADTYRTSPFTPLALGETADLASSLLDFTTAQKAYERLLEYYSFAPQAREAGLALSALYLKTGRWKDALRAADLAAEASTWELRGETLLAAARAAARGGDGAAARVRFEKAHAAAQEARSAASLQRRRASKMIGGEIVVRSDAVMRACEEALASDVKTFTPAPPPAGVEVVGRILRQGQAAPTVRVALAAGVDSQGNVTPFSDARAAWGVSGADGGFRLEDVQPATYTAAAYSCPQPRGRPVWEVARPALPVQVKRVPLALPTNTLAPRRGPPGRAARAPGGGGVSQAGRGGRRGSEAGGRGGGGGRRGGRGGRTGGRGSRGRAEPERGAGVDDHRGGEAPGR
jgi:tetratricopeptide (TPR) repeat protein